MTTSLRQFVFPGAVRVLLPVLVATSAIAQSPPTAAGTSTPELTELQAPYQRNLATIRAAADARTEPVTNAHLAALDRLEKDAAARSESDLTAAIAAERERISTKRNPTPAQRQAMPAALGALRDRYDKDIERTVAPFRQQEALQTRSYLSALDTEQRRLLAQNQIQKAAMIAAERTAVAGEPAGKNSGRNDKSPAESTVRSAGKLDPVLAEKIAAAAASKSYQKTDSSHGGQEGGTDVPEGGAVLVGFEFMEVKNPKGPWIRSLRPYFMTQEAVVPGKDRGKMLNVTDKVLARPGFAVSGLLTSDGKTGMQAIFTKFDPATGRFDPSPNSTYKSKWFGTKGRDKPVQIGGDGRLVIGVFGKTGADCDTIGLVQMP